MQEEDIEIVSTIGHVILSCINSEHIPQEVRELELFHTDGDTGKWINSSDFKNKEHGLKP